MNEHDAHIAAELAKLHAAYREHLPGEIAALSDLAAGLACATDVRERLESLNQRLHRLAGSGGTFGLDVLSTRARTLEQTVQAWLTADFGAVDAVQHQAFADAVAALAGTLDPRHAMGAGTTAKGNSDISMRAKTDQRIHVWLVEDDIPLGETLVHLLGQFGYDVKLFAQIGAAEVCALTERPDILVIDVMFTAAGVGATEAFPQCPALQSMDCPIVFISAQGDFQSRARAARLGAEGFLLKPLDVPDLVGRMERALAERFSAPHRVLIVDDDGELANHYRLVLGAAGMEAVVLTRPEAIIDMVSAFRPELILMDMHMPGYSGPELATVIRHHNEWLGLPIVYLSAETDIHKQLEAMSRGGDDFLTKPITDAHLVFAVKVRAARSRQLADLMSKDSLTGLLKHASIKEIIALEIARAQRSGKPLCVAMLDIDFFKRVNDTYGHAVGDRVIIALAHLLKQRLRKSDGIGRYGGEEFVAILPECSRETAHQVLDDIRKSFATLHFQHDGQEFASTLSAGIACTAEHPEASGDELLIAADTALYAAKHGGRNQVKVAGTTDRNAVRK